MCGAPTQGQTLPAGVDVEKETVITGRVLAADGQPIGGAFVRLLDGLRRVHGRGRGIGNRRFPLLRRSGRVDRACTVQLGATAPPPSLPRARACTTWT